MSTCKMFILYVPMFYFQVDSICDVSLDDDNELELYSDADNDMDNDELTGTIHESSARISPKYNSIEFSNTER